MIRYTLLTTLMVLFFVGCGEQHTAEEQAAVEELTKEAPAVETMTEELKETAEEMTEEAITE